MKRILIPVDFSEIKLNILHYARVLFDPVPATFFLLNTKVVQPAEVLEAEGYGEWLNPRSDDSESGSKDFLREIRRKNPNPNHRFEEAPFKGSLIDAINRTAIFNETDYIVTANKEPQGLAQTFLGSKTLKIIYRVEYFPILVVPRNLVPKPALRIAFATGLMRNFHRNELMPLLELAKISGSTIEVIQLMLHKHLTDTQISNMKSLKEIVKGFDVQFHKIQVKTSEADAIGDFVSNSDIDLVSLVNHRYGFFRKIIQENVVRKITFNSLVPILILPELN